MNKQEVVKEPSDLLNLMLNHKVKLRVKDKKTVVGNLKAFDNHYNVLVSNCEERNEQIEGKIRKIEGNTFIRGDVIISISLFK